MKKIMKVLSIASLASMLAITSGCSCKASKKSTEEVTTNLANSGLGYLNDKYIDYVATFESSKVTAGVEVKLEITVKRDVDNDIFVFELSNTWNGLGEEETINEKQKLYKTDGKVYLKDMNSDDDPVLVNYSTTYYAYENIELFDNYAAVTEELYEIYKTLPFNACSTKGNKNDVYDIYTPSSQLLECEAKKTFLKKEYTYTIGYNTSLIEWDEVAIEVNKEHLMTDLDVVKRYSDNSTESFSLSISYSDIDLTKSN